MLLNTGFPKSDAAADFARERRRRSLAKLASRLSRGPGNTSTMLRFEDVAATLGWIGEHDAGLQTIAVESVVGTVGRRSD